MQRQTRGIKQLKNNSDYEVEEDTQYSRRLGKRGRPYGSLGGSGKRKDSSDESSIEGESGDEHEHFDGVVSDHPSDEQSDENDS